MMESISSFSNTFASLIFVALAFVGNMAKAQSGISSPPATQFHRQVVPPSPEAANLGRYGEFPVSLSNGLPGVSIPIYEIKSGPLSMPINLSYHMGGVKGYDIASSVGLGWTLSAGGAISRVINGIADDDGMINQPFPSPTDPGDYYSCFIGHLAEPNPSVDGQSDSYSINVGGVNSKFIFKDVLATGTPNEIVTIPYSHLKITPNATFSAFTVVGEDGTTYEFGAPEHTQVVGSVGLVSNSNTSWYLTKITAPDKVNTITLTYTDPYAVITATASNSMSLATDAGRSLNERVSYSHSSTTSTHDAIHVKDITFNNGKVTFEYASDRIDVPAAKRLTAIKVFQQKNGSFNQISQFDFAHDYFTATNGQTSLLAGIFSPLTSTNRLYKRLKLLSVTETGFSAVGQTTKPPYSFSYAEGQFPIYGTTAQDFMGYYNGAHSNQDLIFFGVDAIAPNEVSIANGANRNVHSTHIKAGLLQKITFPTGGFTQFEMEAGTEQQSYEIQVKDYYSPTTYQLTSRNPSVNVVVINVTSAMTGIYNFVDAIFSLSAVNSIPTDQKFELNVTVRDDTENRFADFLPLSGPGGPYPAQAPIFESHPTDQYNNKLHLVAGHQYTFTFGSTLPAGSENSRNFFYATINWQAEIGSHAETVNRTINTGLRVKSILTGQGQDTLGMKMYNYNKWYFNSNLFAGDIAQIASAFQNSNKRWYSAGGSQWLKTSYHNYGENVTFQLGSSGGSAVAYEEVEEMLVDKKQIPLGKTVTTFRKAVDEIPNLAPSFRSDWEWKRNQVSKQSIQKLNASNLWQPVQEVTYAYNDSLIAAATSYTGELVDPNSEPDVGQPWFRQCNTVGTMDVYNAGQWFQYSYKSDVVQKTTDEFNPDGSPGVALIETYNYANPKHSQLTKSTQSTSTDKSLIKNIKYSYDFSPSSCDVGPCAVNYNQQMASLKVSRNSCETTNYAAYRGATQTSAADAAFQSYLNCKITFQSGVQATVAAFTNCKNQYDICISNAITQASEPNKAILSMQRNNELTKPIEVVDGFVVDGAQFVTNASRTDFTVLQNSSVEPGSMWTFNSSVPVAKGTFDGTPSTYYQQVGHFDSYDQNHNIVRMTKQDDAPVTYIWDYDGRMPIAEIVNSKEDEVAYTSFEADGDGHWSITGSARNSGDAKTGGSSYLLSDGAISTQNTLQLSQVFKISLWAKSGSVSINSSALTAVYTGEDGWNYYEKILTGISTVTVDGTALIDELRLRPKSSKITTYTYNPLIGVTSTTDDANVSQLYSYDGLGRLITVKDSQGNLVKGFKYHYSSQQDNQ